MNVNEKRTEEDAQENEKFFKKRMEGLREAYDKTPVPEELRERVLQGIAQAKAECSEEERNGRLAEGWETVQKKEEKGADSGDANLEMLRNAQNGKQKGKQKRPFFRYTGLAAAALLAVFVGLVNFSPVTARAMSRLPVIGVLAKIVTFRTFEDEEGGFSGKVSVPKIDAEGGTEAKANEDIAAYADSLIKQYEEDLRASNGEGNYSLQSDWDVVFENEKYVCIRIRTTLIMASGTEYVKVFTVDKATGETVSLAEILGSKEKLEEVSENIKEQMRAQMEADDSKVYFIDSDTPDMDFQSLSGDESYYFDQDGALVISFDEYTVAPGYMGAVSFTIPKEITGELTK